jgi:hypothetical protein
VRFEVFTAVTMKNVVFFDVSPCISCVNRCFGGTYRIHLQGRKIRERGTSVSMRLQTAFNIFSIRVIIQETIQYNFVTYVALTPQSTYIVVHFLCVVIIYCGYGRGEISTGAIWMNWEPNGTYVVALIKGLTFYSKFDQNPNLIPGVVHYSSCQPCDVNTKPR